MKKIKLFTSIHKATKRNYLKRMNDNKPYYMSLAKNILKITGMVNVNQDMVDINILMVIGNQQQKINKRI